MQIGAVMADEPPGRSRALACEAPPIFQGSLPGTTRAAPVSLHPVVPFSRPALGTGVYWPKSFQAAKFCASVGWGAQS